MDSVSALHAAGTSSGAGTPSGLCLWVQKVGCADRIELKLGMEDIDCESYQRLQPRSSLHPTMRYSRHVQEICFFIMRKSSFLTWRMLPVPEEIHFMLKFFFLSRLTTSSFLSFCNDSIPSFIHSLIHYGFVT
ncbi:hypothetical protein TNCT_347611 [Trichonephila clavata]|uniref:Uncharacterized protein n=1 Tax=Trichonephila clavata TaxID=2740835 RepID=A0A8X6L031_TRICU|nr:hypothetical protein TNCT_347611 [Trichonephila clavata]